MSRTRRYGPARVRAGTCMTLAALVLASAIVVACDSDALLSPGETTQEPPVRVLGLVEVTISGLGSGMSDASALSARDVQSLERLRSARAAGPGAVSLLLEAPANIDATGDGTIQLAPLATGSFTDGVRGVDGVRYVYATFRVRNAQSDGIAYNTPRQNLTFLAAATATTLAESAISSLEHFDGSAADDSIAADIAPTGSVMRPGASDGIEPAASDVLQVITEAEAAAVLADAPAGVTTVFPYGFVVGNPATPGSRALSESPAAGEYDGLVTFAFRVPLALEPADDVYSITAVFVATDDTETRVTESLEEQGSASAQAGADALTGSSVTLLGNSTTVIAGHGARRICTARTAGTDPLAPAATLVDADACGAGTIALPASVIVVDGDAAPGGDGRSWAAAYRFIQDALACARDEAGVGEACEGVDEVWVAEGTYYTDEGAGQTNDAQGARYEMIEGVSLYGGFAGVEYSRDQRNVETHVVTLDGDIDGDGSLSGNTGTILYFDGNLSNITRATVVDGFTIRSAIGGATDGAVSCHAMTGGQCSPTLRNLVLTANRTQNGAMIIAANSGGVAAPIIDGVTFTDNVGTTTTSALHVFANVGSTAAPIIVRSSFDGNNGLTGGAVVLRRSDGVLDVEFQSVMFRNNDASSIGGAISSDDGVSLAIHNSEFWNNTTTGGGGAVYASGANLVVSSSTFARNTSGGGSGALYIASGEAAVYNSVFYGNSGASIEGTGLLAAAVANYSLIEGGCPALFTCTSILDTDPNFVNEATGDLRLGGASPAVNAGLNALLGADPFDLDGDGDTAELLPLDLGGGARVVNWGGGAGAAIVDMGAYERQ